MSEPLAREEIEQRAEQVLADVPAWIWDGARLPVPVEHIADSCFGLLVRDVEPSVLCEAPGAPSLEPGHTLSGVLIPSAGEIWVNASEARDWPPRRRFTIGHELGHWCLHSSTGQQRLFCREASVDDDQEPGAVPPRRAPAETEANFFAAALLMPAALVREHYVSGGEFGRWCRLFDVSGAAMGRRLHTVI